jgi:hypothetical protein
MKARGGEAHDEFLNAIPLYALDDRAFLSTSLFVA